MYKNCSDTEYNCIIVGAGAAGLFYAAADETEGRKLIIEKTSCPGQKLLMSGNGMCNITHDGSIKNFIVHYGGKGAKIRTCLYKHNNLELTQFMEHAGVPLKERPDGKIFPASMKAADVLDALLAKADRNDFAFLYDCAVTGIDAGSKGNHIVCISLSDGRKLQTQKLVIATGGASYPATGSDGSFMDVLKRDLNIAVTALKPALAPVFVEHYPYSELSGISFDDVTVSCGGHTERGPILLTHKGFSGPAMLHISQYVKPGEQLTINYLPDRSIAEVYRTIRDDQPANSKGIANYLAGKFGLPKAFAEKLFSVPSRKLSSIGHKELENIVHLMMDRKHTVSGTGGFKEAMVTAGGVSLDEMNLKNMSLIKYPCIYVIGEALDINGDTGGYNLQFAYSSARAAI